MRVVFANKLHLDDPGMRAGDEFRFLAFHVYV